MSDTTQTSDDLPVEHDHAWRLRRDLEPQVYKCDLCPATWPA